MTDNLIDDWYQSLKHATQITMSPSGNDPVDTKFSWMFITLATRYHEDMKAVLLQKSDKDVDRAILHWAELVVAISKLHNESNQ